LIAEAAAADASLEWFGESLTPSRFHVGNTLQNGLRLPSAPIWSLTSSLGSSQWKGAADPVTNGTTLTDKQAGTTAQGRIWLDDYD